MELFAYARRGYPLGRPIGRLHCSESNFPDKCALRRSASAHLLGKSDSDRDRRAANRLRIRARRAHRGRMLIRRELPGDVEAIRAVIAAAFDPQGAATPVEVGLVDELRASDAWLPALSLVAIRPDGKLVGHVVCTRARIGE